MTQILSRIRPEALIGRRSSFIVLAIVYEWQTRDKKPQRSNGISNKTANVCGIWSSPREAFEFFWSPFADEHNTLPKSTRRNVKLNKFAFGTLSLPDLLCKHWFTSSVWNFCRWVADVPPREPSLIGDERGETSAVRRLPCTKLWFFPSKFCKFSLFMKVLKIGIFGLFFSQVQNALSCNIFSK